MSLVSRYNHFSCQLSSGELYQSGAHSHNVHAWDTHEITSDDGGKNCWRPTFKRTKTNFETFFQKQKAFNFLTCQNSRPAIKATDRKQISRNPNVVFVWTEEIVLTNFNAILLAVQSISSAVFVQIWTLNHLGFKAQSLGQSHPLRSLPKFIQSKKTQKETDMFLPKFTQTTRSPVVRSTNTTLLWWSATSMERVICKIIPTWTTLSTTPVLTLVDGILSSAQQKLASRKPCTRLDKLMFCLVWGQQGFTDFLLWLTRTPVKGNGKALLQHFRVCFPAFSWYNCHSQWMVVQFGSRRHFLSFWQKWISRTTVWSCFKMLVQTRQSWRAFGGGKPFVLTPTAFGERNGMQREFCRL